MADGKDSLCHLGGIPYTVIVSLITEKGIVLEIFTVKLHTGTTLLKPYLTDVIYSRVSQFNQNF